MTADISPSPTSNPNHRGSRATQSARELGHSWPAGLCLLGLLGAAAPQSARAQEPLDLDRRVRAHRLTAVALVGPDCNRACKQDRSVWRSLLREHRRDDLHVIVIQKPGRDGRCGPLNWAPSEKFCDRNGRLRAQFGVESNLPAAFLWSWRGPMLVVQGQVADIRLRVKEWVRRSLRVKVTKVKVPKRSEISAEELHEFLETGLMNTGRITLVAKSDPPPTGAPQPDASANTQLEAKIVRGRLTLTLWDVVTKTARARADGAWDPKSPASSAAWVVSQLMLDLNQAVEFPKDIWVPKPETEAKAKPAPSPKAPPAPSPKAPPAPAPPKPKLAWDTAVALHGGVSFRARSVNSIAYVGAGFGAHMELRRRDPMLGFGLTADLDLFGYTNGVLEVPARFGFRVYAWRLFVGANAGLNLLDAVDDGIDDDGEMKEKLSGPTHAVVALPFGYSWEHLEVVINLMLQLYGPDEKADLRKQRIDPTAVRALSAQATFGWRF